MTSNKKEYACIKCPYKADNGGSLRWHYAKQHPGFSPNVAHAVVPAATERRAPVPSLAPTPPENEPPEEPVEPEEEPDESPVVELFNDAECALLVKTTQLFDHEVNIGTLDYGAYDRVLAYLFARFGTPAEIEEADPVDGDGEEPGE